MEWKRGDVLISIYPYGTKVIFLEYTYNYEGEATFKGEDTFGYVYDDYLVKKFRKEE